MSILNKLFGKKKAACPCGGNCKCKNKTAEAPKVEAKAPAKAPAKPVTKKK